MIKDKMNTVISNWKFNIADFKISPNVIKRFFILIIDNKYIKNTDILQFLLGILADNINILNYFFLLGGKKSKWQ